ncbi:MAG: hypothetical protein Q8Q36_00120 [bacterium]|nr:hypothetical protein [bacterium]
MNGEREKGAVEKLSEALYRNDGMVKRHREGTLHRSDYEAKEGWETPAASPRERENDGSSFFRKFFLGSIAFFVISVAFALFMFYGGGNVVSNEKIGLSILGPAFTEGGNPFELQFDVKNGNREQIEYADLIIEYPKGATLAGDRDTVRQRKFLGEIGAGRSVSERATIVLFGEEGSERTVKATLEYRVQGSNAIFVKEASYLVQVKSSPLLLSAESQKEANSNQPFELSVETLANAEKVVENILLKVEYPSGFVFSSASPAPTYGNNVWRFGDLAKGARKKVSIKGTISGEDGEERSFRIYAGSASARDPGEIGVVYNSLLQTVAIKRPFLETELLLNGEAAREYVVGSDATLEGSIEWTNNLPNRVQDAEIYVKFVGDVLDESSVSATGAFYNSGDNTLSWNKDTTFSLGEVEGGANGTFSFSFKLLPLFSGNRLLFRNPELALEVGVRGRRLSEEGVPEDIAAVERKVIRVNSSVQLSSRALYRSGPFANTGPLPPRADKETTYAVTWTAVNSANDLSKAVVRTKLPSYVRFMSRTSPEGEDVAYIQETREVVWNLGRLEQGTGIESASRQVSFQIGLTPSLSQVGTSPSLTGEIVFEGEDAFTRGGIVFSRSALTTRLLGDTGTTDADGIVTK